jgi:NAD(P)-dependent dehydrogenase (short-subunit alcohol dehydrogenase family)
MRTAVARSIVLTGASRGLGRALVEGFVTLGHSVHGCARDGGKIAELARRYGPPHSFTVVDVSVEAQVRAWAEGLLAAGPAPDLLVNNAAVMTRVAPLWEVPAAEFDRLVAVNVSGVAHCVRYFVPAMVARRRGVIVNLSSGWGRSVSAEVAPYCASKFAIEGLTQALAQELPEGMAAVPLNPGIIDTDMLRSCWGDGADAYPTPDRWAEQAVPYILALGAKDNGRPRTVPQ